MRKINNLLTLSSVQLNAYGSDSYLAQSSPAVELFDNRSEFCIDRRQSALAVLMTFTNEGCLMPEPCGVRRQVSATLIDATTDCLVNTSFIAVYIPKNRLTGIYRVDIPFAYADIDPDRAYKVVVRDESSRRILSERSFTLIDETRYSLHPSDWFMVDRAFVTPAFSSCAFTSVMAEYSSCYKVRFDIETQMSELPGPVPEFELRITFHNGSTASGFFTPVCDDYDLGKYHVEIPFIADSYNIGLCYAELICMDYPVGGFAFSTRSDDTPGYRTGVEVRYLEEYSIEAVSDLFRSYESQAPTTEICEPAASDEPFTAEDLDRAIDEFISSQSEDPAEEAPECSEPILATLDHLTGLERVKEKLSVYEKVVRFNRMRADMGMPVTTAPLHAMFLGSPGTGKTTVARLMGRMLAAAGVLSRGHVVVRERSTLLGPNYSMEETNTLNAIEEARGGILLIDEAYQLYQPADPRDPGRFVIEALMTALADDSRRDWMLILAGYPEEMKRMFDMNPGLKSRIPDSNLYFFDDFSASQLMEIAEGYLKRYSFTLSSDAREALSRRLSADHARRDRKFGNARHVINLLETDVLPAMAVRVLASETATAEALTEIQAADIPAPVNILNSARQRIGFCA